MPPPAPRGVRAAAAAVGALPALLGIEAAVRLAQGWRPAGAGDAAVLGLLAAAAAPPLLALVPRAAASRALPRVLLLEGTLLLCALAVEGTLRAAAPLPRDPTPWPPRTVLETRGEPRLAGIRGPARFTTNSRGFRGPEADPADALRVVAVGGSTTECLYLDDAEAWPELVRRDLERRAGRRTWLGNAGRAGLNSRDHLVHLRDLPEVGAADAVVVLCGINDMFRHLGGTWGTAAREAEERALFRARPPAGTPAVLRAEAVLRARTAARNLRRRLREDREVVQDREGLWVEERRALRARFPRRDDLPDLAPATEAYRRSILDLVAAARARGTRLLLVAQPTLYGETVDPATEGLLYGSVQAKQGFGWSTPALHRAMSAFNEALAAAAAETGTPCLRLDRRLPRGEGLLYDDCHFTEEGARRVAEAVTPALEELLKTPAPPRQDGGAAAGPREGR